MPGNPVVKQNFPNSSASFVTITATDAEGRSVTISSATLSQPGQYLLQALWKQAFNNAQGVYPAPQAPALRVALPALPGSPTQAQFNAQTTVLTELLSALIQDLQSYGSIGK